MRLFLALFLGGCFLFAATVAFGPLVIVAAAGLLAIALAAPGLARLIALMEGRDEEQP